MPNHVGTNYEQRTEPLIEEPKRTTAPHEFFDTNSFPIPHGNWEQSMYKQFVRFVEVILKIYIKIPHLDLM